MKPQLLLFLSFACFIGFATLICAAPSIAIEPLNEAEKGKLAAVETAAKKTTAMREATETFNTLRKAYQLDRQKFPADRNPELAVRYRKGLANYEMAKKKAMMEVDPSIGSLLQRQAELAKLGMGKANEGETLADSDSSKNLAIKPIKDEPGLPRVLLIGDSISIGYTLQVRERLKGEANVHRIPMNGGATEVGLEKIQAWLGSEKWDVIHFNFGLHDAKYASETTQRASRDEYVANLEKLVVQMKATGTRLIFATTTPVPMGGVLSPTRKFDSIEERNKLAVKLMESLDVAIDDLYSIVLPVQEEVGRSNDVHYQPEGYAVLADAVAASIRKELKMIRLSSKRDPLTPTFSLANPGENEQEKTKVGSAASISILYAEEFQRTEYGHIPNGWRDLIDNRPSRNWIVDGEGFLRPVIKNAMGLLVYDGYTAEPKPAKSIANACVIADFKKTEDESVKFGVVGRIQDRDNYYLARFGGTQILELIQVKEGVEVPLDAIPLPNTEKRRPTGMMTTRRYREGTRWKLSLVMDGDLLTASVVDHEGREQATLSARNRDFEQGHVGLCCTTFAAASAFRIESLGPIENTANDARLKRRNAIIASEKPSYPIIRPDSKIDEINTLHDRLAAEYDVIVAGAGTGGWAAAIQASRLGSRVLLLEESDWIGGQMSAAAVTTMDEDGVWMKFPVRERGIYREFHESMVAYYSTLDKDPFIAYYSWPDQMEGGYEPKVTRAVLYGFIKDVRDRGAVLDLSLRTKVVSVKKDGNTVKGATLAFFDGTRLDIASKVLIDATEYGDVIPLTGARYRIGNSTSDKVDLAALVQDHTWTCVIREYPDGVPEHLQIKTPPPGYESGSGKRYRNYTNDGVVLWGGVGKGIKGHRHWRVYFAWRGMADSDSALTGTASARRHTQCGFNGGNDYPVTAATIEDPLQRQVDERQGIYRTLGALYYFQHELGVNWSLAEDEGFATEANRVKMKALNLRPDLEPLAVYLPQHPYVRESRRIIGIQTLTAKDLSRFENAKHVSTSVAMGDYFMDLDHGKTAHAIETDLDSGELPTGGGPFQVPFEVFIPEIIDGFIPAEKNISQSRLANGATRLQPVTMLTGQAAGTIAALAVKHSIQPRALNPMAVQQELLESGCTLIQRWYVDVPWGTKLWRATQMLSLYNILDRPGEIARNNEIPLGSTAKWGIDDPLDADERQAAFERLRKIKLENFDEIERDSANTSAGEFAIAIARRLLETR